MSPIYLIAGSPGVGKSWVCAQLADKFCYIRHDSYLDEFFKYLRDLKRAYQESPKRIITEIPFSISKVQEPLEHDGFHCVNVYIVEPEEVLINRYKEDRGIDIPKGHLTRQKTYIGRAAQQKAFIGTSNEVLEYLKSI